MGGGSEKDISPYGLVSLQYLIIYFKKKIILTLFIVKNQPYHGGRGRRFLFIY